MTVAELIAYLEKHCRPEWEVVIVDSDSTKAIAYVEHSGSERLGIIVPQYNTNAVSSTYLIK